MIWNSLRLSLGIALSIAASQAFAEPELRPGTHKVGFRQQWHYDYGRTYQMKLKDGRSYAPGKAARPVLMNLWYPASPSTGGSRMPRSKYLDFVKGSGPVRHWQKAFQDYNRGVVCGEIMKAPEKDLKPAQRQEWQRYLDSPTNCRLNGKPARGKFPVVVYHQGYGSSVEDNNELCEYLASFGYVVVNSSYLAADGMSFNIDSRIGSAGDINFLVAHLRSLPNVDWTKIGFVGHSGGAHTGLKYRAMQHGVIDAIVSLDTTEDYYSLADPRWTFIKTDILPNIDKMAGPIMMVANPYAVFELADRFTNADRLYFTLKLDHNEFISQGVQALRVAASLAPVAKQVEARRTRDQIDKSYGRLCEFIRFYFDDELKGLPNKLALAKQAYARTKVGCDLPHAEVLAKGVPKVRDYQESTGSIPTPRQVRPMLAKLGAARTAEIIKAAHAKEKTAPIYEMVFSYSLLYELLKANRIEEATAMYATYRDLGLKPAEMFISQAWFGDMTKNYPFAEECLTMLLTLEPGHEEGKKRLEEIRKKMSK